MPAVSSLEMHDATIREMAQDGASDPEIANAIGSHRGTVGAYRRTHGIAGGRKGGGQPGNPGGARTATVEPIAASNAPSDRLLRALRATHLRFRDDPDAPARERPLKMPRPDPAEGMYASSAYACVQAGQKTYQAAMAEATWPKHR